MTSYTTSGICLPEFHDANARCDFCVGLPGHTTEKCLALKFKVQDLLDRKIISFAAKNPNVKSNPMPWHNSPTVNAVERSE